MSAEPSPRPAGRGFAHLHVPTHVVVGRGAASTVADHVAALGSRALVVTGRAHARSTGLLDRVAELLESQGVDVELLEGIDPNPTTTIVDIGELLARSTRRDVVVALGGGSVIDAAKAIAAAARTGASFGTLLDDAARAALVQDALPVVAVPTLPGAASETSATIVLTDIESGRKRSATIGVATPRTAILDPELVRSAPRAVLAPAVADAVCHAVEAGLSFRASPLSDAFAEQAVRMLASAAPVACDVDADPDDRARALEAVAVASNLAGIALAEAGSGVAHPLSHPVSARLDVTHGIAVVAFERAAIAVLAPRAPDRAAKVARWLGGTVGRSDGVKVLLARLGGLWSRLGMTTSLSDLGIDDESAAVVIRDARTSGSRGLRWIDGVELEVEDLYAILDLARAHGPTSGAQRMLDAAASGEAP